jgi:hypothetical protein
MLDEAAIDRLNVSPGDKVRLKDYDPEWGQSKALKASGKEFAKEEAKSPAELAERAFWDDDMDAVEHALGATSTQ